MQIVSVSSLKGGVGKTSVTLGLASAALDADISTVVIDLDPHADASTALGVRAHRGSDVGSMLRRPRRAALTRVAVPSAWTRHPICPAPGDGPALDVAPGSAASSSWDRAEYRGGDLRRLERALTGVTAYDLVLIDCPPSLTALTRMAWAASSTVLSVAEPSLFSVAGSKRTMTALAQSGPSSARPAAGIVINRVRPEFSEHEHRVAELHELFDPLVVDPVLPEAPVLQQIQGAAWPVHRWPGEPAAGLAERFTEILEGLLGRGDG